MTTAKRYEAVKRAIVAAEKRCDQAVRRKHDFERRHMKEHPLSEQAKGEVLEHFKGGGHLCCEKGRAWLSSHVDPVWAELINDWAYEALACNDSRHFVDYLAKVETMLQEGVPIP